MDVLITIVAAILFLGSVIGSILGNMIASELYDRSPTFADWLIDRAVARFAGARAGAIRRGMARPS
jgi:hypothetical protein